MNKLLAWTTPRCARFLLSVRSLLKLRRLVALPVVLLMIWQLVQVSLAAAMPALTRSHVAVQVLGQAATDADVSGQYLVSGDGYGRKMVFYQRGTTVTGTYTFNGSTSSFSGTVSGYTLTGTFIYSGTRNFSATYAADGQSFSGSDSWGSFTGVKQSTGVIRVVPSQAVLKLGETLSIDGLVGGVPDKSIAWSATGGSVDGSGLFTAPATAGVYTVTAASTVQPEVKVTNVIQVTGDGNMDASGSYVVSGDGYGRKMVLYQRGTTVTGTYTFNGSTSAFNGTVNGYTLTGTFTYSGTRNFSATFAADGQSFSGSDSWGSFTATKEAVVSVQIQPVGVRSLDLSELYPFYASVAGSYDRSVSWSTTGGTVADGLFTAPGTPGKYTLTAVAQADSSATDQTDVYVGTWKESFDKWSFEEGKGLSAADSNGRGWTGILANGPTWTNGKVGKALYFDGKNSAVGLPYVLPLSSAFTLSAWVKLDEVGTGHVNTILGAGHAECLRALHCCVNAQDKPYFGFYCQDLTGSKSLAAGVWTHLVFTFDGTTKRIYVNGVLDSSQTSGALTVTDANALIGNYPFSTGLGFKGVIDEVAIYNRALVDCEVAALYASTVNVTMSPHTATLAVGQSQAFAVNVVGSTNAAVTWELPDASSGTITAEGVYTAPITVPAAGASYRVVARSVADSTQTDTVKVVVKPYVRIIPATLTLAANGTYPFQVEVTGLSNSAVVWTASAGAFEGNRYTAPSSPGTYQITATSQADSTKSATMSVVVGGASMVNNGGLVGYWTFDNSGVDRSGNGHTATLVDGAIYAAGLNSRALRLDGLKSAAKINYVNCFNSSFTVSAWVKLDAVNRGIDNAILGHGVASPNQGLHIGERNGKAYFGFYSNDVAGKSDLTANKWTLVTCVYDGVHKLIYINGVLDATQASGAYRGQMPSAEIGSYPWPNYMSKGSVSTCLGLIDEVRIYNRALSAADVGALYSGVPSLAIEPRNAVISTEQTQGFTAGVTGSANTAVTWSLPKAASGDLTADGVYTPPASIPYQGVQYAVKAVSQALPSVSDTVQITVKNPVDISPKAVNVPAGGQIQFSAEVTGLASTDVSWSASSGSISSSGLFSASTTSGSVTVTATSAVDATKLATATVTVTKGALLPDLWLSFEEGTGTSTADAAGSSVVGKLSSSVNWVTGKSGEGVECPVAAATILLSPVVKLGTQWTVASWFQYPFPGTGYRHTLSRGNGGDHQIEVWDDQVSLGCYDNVTGSGFHACGFKMDTLSAGWHHVAAVGQGGKTQFYIDGVAVGSIVPWQSTSDVYCVGNYQGGREHFGIIDEFKIFHRPLGAAEVASLASGIRIQVSPGAITLAPGGTQAFAAAVTGATNPKVTWELPDAGSGSISAAGVYRAPNNCAYDGQRFRVLARSVQDPLQVGLAWVTVSAGAAKAPLAHFPFLEGVGNATQDVSGHGYQGVLVHDPAWVDGKVGKALRFSGSEYVQVSAFPNLPFVLTAAAWIYPTGPGSQATEGGVILGRENEFLLARFADGSIRYALRNSSPGWKFVNTGCAAPLNQWTHLALTYDASTGVVCLWANGAQVYTFTGAGTIASSAPAGEGLRIGSRQANGSYFQGVIDEVRLYDRVLTDDEVSALYALAGMEVYPLEAGVAPGKKVAFSAVIPDLADQRVTWELPSAASGSIEADGTYTAPSGGERSYQVVARSVADVTRTASATVHIRNTGTSDEALVGYWPFNESTGTMVADASLTDNPGKLIDGAAAWTGGVLGNALLFDGANGRVDIPDRAALNPQSLSLSLWLRLDRDPAFDTSSNSWRSILHKGEFVGGSTGYAVYLEKNRSIGFDTGTGSADRWWPNGLTLSIGEWTHLVLAFDAETGLKTAYQDGVLKDSKRVVAKALQANSADLYLNNPSAYLPTGGYGNFPGAFDELRVYNRALTQSDVSALRGRVATVRISPESASLVLGQSQQFSATVTGSKDGSVTWSVLDVGSITSEGLFTAPASISVQGLKTRVQALNASSGARDVVYVTLKRPIQVSPSAVSVPAGGQVAFSAEVSGLADTGVVWTTTGGAIDSRGILTAPATAGSVTVTATSAVDPTQSSTALVTVSPASVLNCLGANFRFQEGSGLQTADTSGHGYIGTLSNTVAWVTGRSGYGLQFGSSASTLLLSPAVELGVAWTLSAWFQYPLSHTGTYHTLARGLDLDHQILINTDEVSLGCFDNSAGKFRDSGFKVSTLGAGWHQVTAVGIAGTTQFYMDGQAVGSLVPWQSTSNVYSLGNYQNGGQAFGAIDEVRIYQRALGPAEIASQFALAVNVTATPAAPTLILGESQAFAAQVTGTADQGVTWSVQEYAGGTITSDGVYTAPATIPAEGTVYHVLARSHADSSKVVSIPVTVRSPIVVSPGFISVLQGTSTTFKATTTNLASTAVTWSVSGGTMGASTGVFVAPAQAGYYTVTATSVSDATKTGTALVCVPAAISVVPAQSTVITGGLVQYVATVTGATGGVSWSLWEPQGGSISNSGLFKASKTPGTYHISAMTQAAPQVATTATVNVVRDAFYQVDPEYVQVKPGATVAFRVLGADLSEASISWSASGGSVSSAGVYTAPLSAGSYTVMATVATDQVQVVAAKVLVASDSPVDSVTVTPSDLTLTPGGTASFTAAVNGGTTGTVTWSCVGGSINGSTGAYTAPSTPGTYTVKATSTEDSSAYGTATVSVKSASGTDQAFTYDGNGNMTSDGTRSFEWDAENRLVAVVITATGHRSEFGYDGLGRRVMIRELDVVATVLTETSNKKYLWDGVEIAEERDTTGAIVTKRFYSQGFVDSDGTLLYYTRDHLGSIRELTDGSQTIRARYDYDPYGRMTKIQGDRDSVFTYTGHFWHGQSGLNLAMFRAYDPNLGRWISRDPIEDIKGLSLRYLIDILNLYTYVAGRVVNLTDRTGLSCGEQPASCPLNDKPNPNPNNDSNPSNAQLAQCLAKAVATYVSCVRKSRSVIPYMTAYNLGKCETTRTKEICECHSKYDD
nr:LamG-like jellyroll fold domain-containing protein [uncultured Holophaga sp.]